MTTTIEKDVDQALTELGFTLDVQTIDPGGYKKESVHQVTVKRNNQSFTTTYTMGPLRLWGPIKRLPWNVYYRQRPDSDIYRLTGSNAQINKPKEGKEATVLNEYKRGDWCEDYDKATTHRPVTLADVMYSLVMDASCVRNGQSFDDFCSEFGNDNDSIKARKCFDGCRDEWSGLIRLGVDLDQLDELFQDY